MSSGLSLSGLMGRLGRTQTVVKVCSEAAFSTSSGSSVFVAAINLKSTFLVSGQPRTNLLLLNDAQQLSLDG
jgi:hypothetical protein